MTTKERTSRTTPRNQKRVKKTPQGAERQRKETERPSPIGNWSWIAGTDTKMWSNEMYSIHGRDPGLHPPTLKELPLLMTPDSMDRLTETCERSLDTGKPQECELEILRPDGQTRWFKFYTVVEQDESGSGVLLHGTEQDITKRKRAEEATVWERNLNRTIFDNMPSLFFMLSTERRLLRWNKNLTVVSGYGDEEIARMNPMEFFPESERGNVSAHLQEAFSTGESSLETQVIFKDGTLHPVYFTGKVLHYEGAPCLVAMAIDFTERMVAEEEKATLEDQLRQAQKMEAIGRLAGGVAHDFNNMLTVIIGYTNLIKTPLSADNPLLLDILEIEGVANRSKEITNQLLAFSRKQPIAPTVLDLNDIIMKMQKTLARLIGEDIVLTFCPGNNLWKIKFDPSQIEQILINLAANAGDERKRVMGQGRGHPAGYQNDFYVRICFRYHRPTRHSGKGCASSPKTIHHERTFNQVTRGDGKK